MQSLKKPKNNEDGVTAGFFVLFYRLKRLDSPRRKQCKRCQSLNFEGAFEEAAAELLPREIEASHLRHRPTACLTTHRKLAYIFPDSLGAE